MLDTLIKVFIEDAMDNGSGVSVEIQVRDYGITIKPEGYESNDGGEPIMIMASDGKPQLLVWDDINKHHYTKVGMEGAKIERRKKRTTETTEVD